MSEETVKRNPARSCPKCQSENVTRKMTFRTVLVLGAMISASFGKNACRDCGHKWR